MIIMNIFLYQIWYDEQTKPDEQSGLLSFDCRRKPEFLKREIAHLIRFYDEIVINANDNDYFSLLSPRFFEKTGLTTNDITQFALNNPNHDIYLFNPYPMNTYLYLNVWEQGEEHHRGLKQLAQNLLNKSNIDFDISASHRNTINSTIYCNYWLASKKFFDDFITFIKKLDKVIDDMPNHEKEQYFQKTDYFRTTAIFYPFIFERMLSLFLLINNQYQVLPYIYQPNSLIYNNLKNIHRKFYFGGYREKYDRWENISSNQKYLEANFKQLKHLLSPNVSIFPFRTLNRWTNSIIKKINMHRLDKILQYLKN